MNAPPRTLLAMPKGPVRGAAARVLRALGAQVVTASDPYEATARFAECPADLVVASLDRWTRRDLGFLVTARHRSPGAAVLVLLPEGRRPLAAAALEAGADAYLLEPLDLREFSAVARRLLRRDPGRPGADDPAALPSLAAEVSHAVGNPLQVLSLLLEEGGAAPAEETRAALRSEVDRIRRAVEVVAGYGRLSAPERSPTDLAALLAERRAILERQGVLASPTPSARFEGRTRDPVEAAVDAAQVGAAVETVLRFLAARAGATPARVRAVARRCPSAPGRLVEVAARARGVHLPPTAWDEAVRSVLRVEERSRVPYPGLALARAVARAHGGDLLARDTDRGTLVALRLAAS